VLFAARRGPTPTAAADEDEGEDEDEDQDPAVEVASCGVQMLHGLVGRGWVAGPHVPAGGVGADELLRLLTPLFATTSAARADGAPPRVVVGPFAHWPDALQQRVAALVARALPGAATPPWVLMRGLAALLRLPVVAADTRRWAVVSVALALPAAAALLWLTHVAAGAARLAPTPTPDADEAFDGAVAGLTGHAPASDAQLAEDVWPHVAVALSAVAASPSVATDVLAPAIEVRAAARPHFAIWWAARAVEFCGGAGEPAGAQLAARLRPGLVPAVAGVLAAADASPALAAVHTLLAVVPSLLWWVTAWASADASGPAQRWLRATWRAPQGSDGAHAWTALWRAAGEPPEPVAESAAWRQALDGRA
jgi:hypothetical protein